MSADSSALPQAMGVYVHWPFCLSKCPYCDFNSHVREAVSHDAWRTAFIRSIERYAELLPDRSVSSIYFGGGTPSLMEPETVRVIIDKIQSVWRFSNNIEITLEANPTSIEAARFKAFKEAGVNRVSVGVQALNDNDLSFLGRKHNVDEALDALDIAKENFDRYSYDLIYARPNQNLKDWSQELEKAVEYAGEHLSLYQLTIERGTQFFQDYARGDFSIPNEELSADFYNLTQDIMGGAGLPAYEVSNHAAVGQESRHNLIYWQYQDYVGIGPGAHGRITVNGQKMSTREHRVPEIWLQRVKESGSGAHPFENVARGDQFTEAFMMGLRLRDGVSLSALAEIGDCVWEDQIDEVKLRVAVEEGWAVHSGERLSLTREGILRLNALVPYLLR